jgi:hypothetical protein
MVRDSVANFVESLQTCGFDPRRVGDDQWEARCPQHRGAEHALLITRNERGHVEFTCRGTLKCTDYRIVKALGITNEHVYAETPEWLISRLRRVPVSPASFQSSLAPAMSEPVLVVSAEASHQIELSPGAGLTPVVDRAGEMLGADRAPWEKADANAGALDGASTSEVAWLSKTSVTMTATSPLEPAPGDLLALHAPADSSTEETGRDVAPASEVQVLTLVASWAKLFRANDGRLFAQVPVGDRHEIYALKSAGFRDWLIHGYLNCRPAPPSQVAIRRVIGMLEARARFEVDIPEVFIRIGKQGEGDGLTYFVDLGDRSGRAIAIRDRGWLAVDQPDVHFRRPEGQLPLPMPRRDGSIDLLRPYVNLTEPDFRLMVAWLTAVLRPVGPHPILVLGGEQASAKSTLVKVLRLLIDPHACIALNVPSSTRDLMATAVNGWLLAYDNISDIPRWLSDALCQLVFGGAISGRALLTNEDRSFIYAQRPVLLSGIGDFIRWADLKDRCVFLHQAARLVPNLCTTPAKLLAWLTELVGKKVASAADWPRNTAKFSTELRQLAPQLRLHGINISFERRNEGRFITLEMEQGPNSPSPRSSEEVQ